MESGKDYNVAAAWGMLKAMGLKPAKSLKE